LIWFSNPLPPLLASAALSNFSLRNDKKIGFQ